MGKLLFALIVVLLLVAADIGARVYSQDQLAQHVDEAVAGAQAKVTISGFPFLGKLAAEGRVDKITAQVAQAGDGNFILDDVVITVTGVRVDRSWFLQHHQLKIDSIDSGKVVADMTQANFDRLVGLPLVFRQGVAQGRVAGITVSARVSIVDNRLVVSGLPISIPIPELPVLPCTATVQIVPGNLVASCTFTQVPPALQLITPSLLRTR